MVTGHGPPAPPPPDPPTPNPHSHPTSPLPFRPPPVQDNHPRATIVTTNITPTTVHTKHHRQHRRRHRGSSHPCFGYYSAEQNQKRTLNSLQQEPTVHSRGALYTKSLLHVSCTLDLKPSNQCAEKSLCLSICQKLGSLLLPFCQYSFPALTCSHVPSRNTGTLKGTLQGSMYEIIPC